MILRYQKWGAEDNSEKRIYPLIASRCLCQAWMERAVGSEQVLFSKPCRSWQFYRKYSRTYRLLFVFSLYRAWFLVALHHSHSSSVSLRWPEQGHLSSLSVTVFSRVAGDNTAGQCRLCWGCGQRATGMLTLSKNNINTESGKCLRCYWARHGEARLPFRLRGSTRRTGSVNI